MTRFAFGLLLLGASLTAQQPTFRSAVQTVAIYATVHDRDGRLVTDLTQDAFEVRDDGRPVSLSIFSNEIQPIIAVVLLDTSGSMVDRFPRVRTAMLAFIEALRPADRVRIGTFGGEIALSPHLTADKAQLTRIVNEELWPRGGATPLWSAMQGGMDSLASESGRRVIVVVTDGVNAGPSPPGWPYGLETRATKQANDQEFLVYGIGFAEDPRSRAPTRDVNGFPIPITRTPGLDGAVTDLAIRTGGGHLTTKDGDDLTQTLAAVADELRHQYMLGFTPAVLDGKSHKLEVRMTRPRMTARARTSYRALGNQ